MDLCNLEIAVMEEKHIKEIATLEKECFSLPWSENALREELTNEVSFFQVALIENKVVGYMGLLIVCDEAYIANIAVNKEYRNKGIAKSLLNGAKEKCIENKALFMSLEVRKSNDIAINLYKSYGFEVIGERKNFYSKPLENAIILTLYL